MTGTVILILAMFVVFHLLVIGLCQQIAHQEEKLREAMRREEKKSRVNMFPRDVKSYHITLN